MEQKYRMLEKGEVIQEGDEIRPSVAAHPFSTRDRWEVLEKGMFFVGATVGATRHGIPVPERGFCRPVSEVNIHGSPENSTGKVVTDAVPQKYRDLTPDDFIQLGDEVWEFGRGPWGPVSKEEHGQQYMVGYWRMRRPVAAEITNTKQQLESLTKSWYDQRADLAEAGNQITDLTRRLEDALSDKVIAENRLKNLERHVEEEHVTAWARIQEVLPETPEDSRSSLVDDIIGYMHQLARERDNWQKTAAQNARNQEFYYGLVTDIGNMFGLRARIADDGTICENVLALRVPELVAELIVKKD